jgi:hypothetical protein
VHGRARPSDGELRGGKMFCRALNSFDEGPGDDDLEGGIFAVGVTGRAIFVGFFKMGILDKSMVREEEKRGSGRQLPQTGDEVKLQELKNIPKKVLQRPLLRMHPLIDAADLPHLDIGLSHASIQKFHLPRSR